MFTCESGVWNSPVTMPETTGTSAGTRSSTTMSVGKGGCAPRVAARTKRSVP
jgi:hypothetical protein